MNWFQKIVDFFLKDYARYRAAYDLLESNKAALKKELKKYGIEHIEIRGKIGEALDSNDFDSLNNYRGLLRDNEFSQDSERARFFKRLFGIEGYENIND